MIDRKKANLFSYVPQLLLMSFCMCSYLASDSLHVACCAMPKPAVQYRHCTAQEGQCMITVGTRCAKKKLKIRSLKREMRDGHLRQRENKKRKNPAATTPTPPADVNWHSAEVQKEEGAFHAYIVHIHIPLKIRAWASHIPAQISYPGNF